MSVSLWSSQYICGHLSIFGVMSVYLGSCQYIWGHLSIFGVFSVSTSLIWLVLGGMFLFAEKVYTVHLCDWQGIDMETPSPWHPFLAPWLLHVTPTV